MKARSKFLCLALITLSCFAFTRFSEASEKFRATAPPPDSSPTPAPTPTPVGWKVVKVDDFSGDLATRIDAAEIALGARAGEILITGHEPITRVVKIGTGHVWNISGTHMLKKGSTPTGLIWMSDWSTLAGTGTLQIDVTGVARPRMVETVEGMKPFEYAAHDANIATGITVTGIEFRDEPGANPTAQTNAALNLGNCHKCKVQRVRFTGLNDFGVQVGGHAVFPNKWAEDVEITDCLLTRVGSQPIAITQGQNILVARNKIISPGRPGNAIVAIDVEGNYSKFTRLLRIKILNNYIDMRMSPAGGAVGGIALTSSALWVPMEDIVVSGNTILGSRVATARKGIETAGDEMNVPNGKRILISENKVSDFGQVCIVAAGDDVKVIKNTVTNCGWEFPHSGPVAPSTGYLLAGILATDLTNSVIKDNLVNGPPDGGMAQISFRGKNSKNVIEGNSTSQILGVSTNSIYRNNYVSGSQNSPTSQYKDAQQHSGIVEDPGSSGNVYEGNKITRADGYRHLGIKLQSGSKETGTTWLPPPPAH
jgi:hypothetical protein